MTPLNSRSNHGREVPSTHCDAIRRRSGSTGIAFTQQTATRFPRPAQFEMLGELWGSVLPVLKLQHPDDNSCRLMKAVQIPCALLT